MSERKLILGISGGIAACKAPILIRELGRRDIEVKTVITENAKKFVTEVTLRSLTGNPVYDRMFVSQDEPIEHISLSDWGDVMLVAPATRERASVTLTKTSFSCAAYPFTVST